MVHRVDKVASHFPVIILNTSLISLITDDCTEAWHAFSETDESLILICNLRLILETGEGVQFIFCKRICYVDRRLTGAFIAAGRVLLCS